MRLRDLTCTMREITDPNVYSEIVHMFEFIGMSKYYISYLIPLIIPSFYHQQGIMVLNIFFHMSFTLCLYL